MKSKQQKSRIILGLMLIIGLFSLHNIGYLDDENFEHYNQNMIIDDLNTSGTYKNITIDNLPGSSNNWVWAESQIWCSGSGTLLDPYIIEGHILNMSMSIDGLKISNSHNKHFIIRHCTFKWNELTNSIPMTGIYLLNTTHGRIEDNLIYHLGYGILLEDCEKINLIDNTIYDHIEGITFDNVNNSWLINNNCSNLDYGIFIKNGSMNNTISGNNASNNADYGIYLYNSCNYNTISNNIANVNGYAGISLEYECYYNTISGNIVNNNPGSGIYFYDYCGHNTISNNFVNSSGDSGISLHWYSSNNTIIDNIANYNQDFGIELYDYCENNTVSNNIVNFNGLNGIGIYDFSDNNTLTENLLFNNTIGVYIDNSDNNLIYENFFAKNSMHAFDDGIDNKWNTTVIGNYWDNLTGPDTSPQDGIVDTPYTFISGPAGSIDYLPIAEDGVPIITINSPHEGGRFGNTAPTFSLTVTDIQIVSLWYTLDDGLHNYTFTGFAGTFAQSAWDTMSDGTITITFYALDIGGNIGTAQITIGKNLPEEFDPTLVIVIVSIVGGVAVVAVVYIFMKKRAVPE
jgi:parallel beta-helix repeat protein